MIEELLETFKGIKKIPWNWAHMSSIAPLKLIQKYPEMAWDYNIISSRVTWTFLIANPDKNWNWSKISSLPWVNMTLVKKYDLPWDYNALSANPSISIDDVLQNQKLPWNWDVLSRNFDFATIEANINLNWNWKIISDKSPMDYGFVRKYIANPFSKVTWDWYLLSLHKDLPKDLVEYIILIACPNDEEIMRNLSNNQNLTAELVKSYTGWDFHVLSQNPAITWKMVQENKGDWDFHELSQNPGITWRDIKNNINHPWDLNWMLS